ncbi:MAG: PAS domain-containing protein [Proteobacteria bacterium]|nr:PAS domain-containing protein [Pseudomonadota bacterium]
MKKKGATYQLSLDQVGSFLAKFSENADQVYWISSPDFQKIQYISPSYERIWGRCREELYTKPEIWVTFLHPDDVADHHPIRSMAEKIKKYGDKARYMERYRIIRPDGEVRWIFDSGFPLIDENGKCYGVSGVAIDVTEDHKKAEEIRVAKEIAELASHAKTEFIANMSHDIRTPLTGIIGMSKLLEDRASTVEDKQYASWVNESGEQLLKLLNGVLDILSTNHLSEEDLHQENFDLYECVNDIEKLERPALLQKGLDFEIKFETDVPQYIRSDRFKLTRILLNLIGNAIKFTEKGKITLKIKHEETMLEFMIEDTGIGIPKHLQKKIFEHFYRVNPNYKNTNVGYGVGLHIVEKYIKLLSGNISLKSREGKGSTFSIRVPLIAVNPATIIKSEIKPISAVTTNKEDKSIKLTILLIEDNIVALKVLERMVSQLDCDFQSAITAEEALVKLETNNFACIITDLGLPGMSGIEMTKKIRQSSNIKLAKIPIFGLTGHSASSVQAEIEEAGMNAVFTKPMQIDILKDIFAELRNNIMPTPVKDLPQTEDGLFALDAYPLLDNQLGETNLGSKAILYEVLQLMVHKDFKEELAKLKDAHLKQNWKDIDSLAHKMKSGALYCGTTKMQYACQYLERYYKSGQTKCLETLYQQLMDVMAQTEREVETWLKNNTPD